MQMKQKCFFLRISCILAATYMEDVYSSRNTTFHTTILACILEWGKSKAKLSLCIGTAPLFG